MNLLKVSGISKRQGGDMVVKEVSFTQQKFQKMAIAGETGSGKSTLLKIIAGLIQPDAGEVIFEGVKVLGPDEKLMPGHPGIAYLSQHFELRNNYWVEEELAYTNKLSDEEAEAIYEVCRISHLLKRRTNQLSGGERQRIVLARILISSPKLLLLDEPFSNLDMVHKNIIKSVINDIGERLKISCILISHDPMDVLSWADEILVMKDGEILQQAPPEQVYRQPVNAYTAGLFGSYNLINPAKAQDLNVFPSINLNGKNILVRPEHFKIVTETDNAIIGHVQQINFFGSYYEIGVQLSANSIIIKTQQCNMMTGDTVYISLSGADVWYL